MQGSQVNGDSTAEVQFLTAVGTGPLQFSYTPMSSPDMTFSLQQELH